MIPVVIQATAGIILKTMKSVITKKRGDWTSIVKTNIGRLHVITGYDYDSVRDFLKSEDVVCKTFGCGKQLSLQESRCGDRCREHSIVEKMDIVNRIKL